MSTYQQLLPKIPPSSSTNQQFMQALAAGTGGFVIVNTNDLLAGLEKINREQDEYYLLAYVPPASDEGSCHTIQVKVDRGGTVVRARSGYCNGHQQDLLAGTTVEKDLEARVAGSAASTIQASMQLPYFYTSPNVARVNVAMEIPADSVKFKKEKGKFQGAIQLLGIAYRADGAVAARFSDTVKLAFEDKKEIEELKGKPIHYENQFDIASGSYTLKVGFATGGDGFGKLESPLVVDPFGERDFTLSAVALSRQVVPLQQADLDLAQAMIEDRKTLVTQGLEIIPSGSSTFKVDEKPLLYVEVYAPELLTPKPPTLIVELRVVDRATGEAKQDSGPMTIDQMVKAGNPVVPVGMRLLINPLKPGAYRAELTASDTAGHTTTARTADFVLQ